MNALDAAAPAPGSEGGPLAAEAIYRAWGWPVVLRREQVWLALESDAVALLIPLALATEVTAVLTDRYCPSAMLTHPYAPEHRILLAGEPFPVLLPWPPRAHRVTTCLLLPPTMTPRGPLTWVCPPRPDALRLCREVDVLAALRAEPRVRGTTDETTETRPVAGRAGSAFPRAASAPKLPATGRPAAPAVLDHWDSGQSPAAAKAKALGLLRMTRSCVNRDSPPIVVAIG